jgi:hypothetical protein
MAWEDASLSLFQRLYRTLGSAFLPVETARAVAEGPLAPALRFSLLSALPWAPWWAIIPVTHLIQFKSGFQYELIEKPGLTLGEDVARAMAFGVIASLLSLLAWAWPFASLLKAFSREPHNDAVGRAGWRMALYRAWLIPLGLTLLHVSLWAMPKGAPDTALILLQLCFGSLPRLLLVVHCFSLARYFGVGPGSSLIVSIVPVAVEGTVLALAEKLAQPLLPVLPVPEG